nr:ASCH domain-containing protein [Clostridia bacterium]
MKTLTIKQPWATLIIQGDKRFEFRSWKTSYRGDLLIHAGKGIDKEAMKRLKKYIPEDMPLGKIIGKVKLVDCIKMSPEFKEMLLKENNEIYTKSSFQENYGWQVENVEVFNHPIPVKGQLSLWEYEVEENSKELKEFLNNNK